MSSQEKDKTPIPIKEITLKDVISFTWKTHNYGRAEFEICPVFANNQLTDLFIYRRQQPSEKDQAYHIRKTIGKDCKRKRRVIEGYCTECELK